MDAKQRAKRRLNRANKKLMFYKSLFIMFAILFVVTFATCLQWKTIAEENKIIAMEADLR